MHKTASVYEHFVNPYTDLNSASPNNVLSTSLFSREIRMIEAFNASNNPSSERIPGPDTIIILAIPKTSSDSANISN